jgi:hypothetical protein
MKWYKKASDEELNNLFNFKDKPMRERFKSVPRKRRLERGFELPDDRGYFVLSSGLMTYVADTLTNLARRGLMKGYPEEGWTFHFDMACATEVSEIFLEWLKMGMPNDNSLRDRIEGNCGVDIYDAECLMGRELKKLEEQLQKITRVDGEFLTI